MTRRLMFFLFCVWQGLMILEQPVYAGRVHQSWPQASFLTGENTFGYPEKVPDNDGFALSAAPGDVNAPDVVEWDEEDALRNHAEPGETAYPESLVNRLFPPYAHAHCAAVSRDIHKPPPENLS